MLSSFMRLSSLVVLSRATALVAVGALASAQVAYVDSLGREWRQLVGTTSRSWTQIAAVCPTDGVTPAVGAVNGIQVTGWVWATTEQVREMLSEFEPALATQNNLSGPAYLLSAFGFFGSFAPTFEFYTTFGGYNDASGWTAIAANGMGEVASVFARWNPHDAGWYIDLVAGVDTASAYRGIWMYRTSAATAPIEYCHSEAPGTSAGCLPSIAASSQPSASAATSCVITASSVDGLRNGLMFYGVSGATVAPWCATSSSRICVRPPTARATLQSTGGTAGACDGALLLDWNQFLLTHPGALGAPFAAGDVVHVQGWFRDPGACKTSSLTSALQLVHSP